MDESEDMEITDEELTFVLQPCSWCEWRSEGGGGREGARGNEWEAEGEGRVKVVINLMEKSNTKQIYSSKLDAPVALFSACAKP